MSSCINLVGQKFGKLIVIERVENIRKSLLYPNGCIAYKCKCECGSIDIIVTAQELRKGDTKSCGCIKHPNLVGQKFGTLMVIERVENIKKCNSRPSGFIAYNCICNCGSYIITSHFDLKSGHIHSCGCDVPQNLIGQKFGKLIVVTKTINKNESSSMPKGYNSYICKCECGSKDIIVTGYNLKQGNTKSCGCLSLPYDNLINQKFGKLKVIKRAENVNKSKSRPWGYVAFDCNCECGGKIVVRASLLKEGNTQSCGCLTIINEHKIGKSLEFNNISYEKRKSLKKINTNFPNFFIDYLIENSIILEYNGEQHYKPVKFGNSQQEARSKFDKQILRDQKLEKFCKDNNYTLIVIDGREYKAKKLEQYLQDIIVPKINKIMKDNK